MYAVLVICFLNWTMQDSSALALTETDCRDCHSGTMVDRHHLLIQAEGFACTYCHAIRWDPVKNSYYPEVIRDCVVCHGSKGHEAAHDMAFIDSPDCLQCHNGNVVTEHSNRGFGCNACHNSTNPTMQQAIERGMNGQPVYCRDCHGVASHEAAHEKAVVPYQDCGNCHATNVVTEHAYRYLDCAVCHSSSDPAVINAIAAGKNGQEVYCADCHVSFGNHTSQHDRTSLPSPGCANCHVANVVTEHENNTVPNYCFSCHAIADAVVKVSIDNGMAGGNITCSACHPAHHGKTNQPPHANAGADQKARIGKTVNLSGSGSYDPDGTIVQYTWEFGDGNTGNGVSVSHVYQIAGIYTVTLTVTDNGGATATDTAVITVEAVPEPVAVYADQVLWIQKLKSVSYSDNAGSKSDVTAKFRDNYLGDSFTIENKPDENKVIAMRLNKDSALYAGISLSLYVKSLNDGKSQTVKIYPYKSDGISIDTVSSVSFTISSPGWTEIDVTAIAPKLKGFGWMKFRITCTTSRLHVSEGKFSVL